MIDLEKMRFLMRRIPKLKWDIVKEQAAATKITTVLTGMPRGSGNHSQTEEGAIRLSIVKEKYTSVMEELNAMKEELAAHIERLDDPFQRILLQLRYIDGLSAVDIAEATHRSERQVYRDLTKAEQEVEKIGQNI